MLTIKTILHPTDFSGRSECAFRLACSLARDHGARVVALHVVPPPPTEYAEGVVFPPAGAFEAWAREQFSRLQPPDAEIRLERRLAHGDAAAEILSVAAETGCELIVMGTHGWTGITRLLMGSVAEQVVRKAPCPVLTVKTPQAERPSDGPAPAAAGREAEAAEEPADGRARSTFIGPSPPRRSPGRSPSNPDGSREGLRARGPKVGRTRPTPRDARKRTRRGRLQPGHRCGGLRRWQVDPCKGGKAYTRPSRLCNQPVRR
jgi:nucleotide-binding universal stress UspA family protein